MRVTCSIDQVKRLRPEELKQVLETDRRGEFVLVDVRQAEEYEAGHIPGARLIPLGDLEVRHGELDKDKKVVTYCRSGHRSIAGAVLLCGLGFKDVYTMDGGILSWGYETLTGIPEERPELISGEEGVGEVLMVALKLEKGSRDFYLRATEKLKSKEAAKTFQRLIPVEEKHMKRIYDRYVELLGGDKLPAFDFLEQSLTPEYMEGGIEINKALLDMQEREFRDEMESLEVALEKEYLAYDFYKRTAGVVGNGDTKALLHEIAGEERNHINSLLSDIRKIVESEHR